MHIDVKTLNAFLKTCRKHGVTEITLEGMHVKMTELKEKVEYVDAEESFDDLSADMQTLAMYGGSTI